MASARELLEQADALMRKNRGRGDGDIPLLTDAVEVAIAESPVLAANQPLVRAAEPAAAPLLVAVAPDTAVSDAAVSDAAVSDVDVSDVDVSDAAISDAHVADVDVLDANASDADVPVLTDAVDDALIDFGPLPPEREALCATMEGDPSDWLVSDTIDPSLHSITGRAPDTLAVLPPITLKAAGSAATPPPQGSQGREEAPEPVDAEASAALEQVLPMEEQPALAPADESPLARTESPPSSGPVAKTLLPAESAPAIADQELWRELAEQISMQVLQRLDLFTDSGLKSQLAQRLEPIVERASAELVGALTEQVGRLVRTYVSEAIEREIAQWKRDQH